MGMLTDPFCSTTRPYGLALRVNGDDLAIVGMTMVPNATPDSRVEALYCEHRSHLLGVAIAMCRNREMAEECVQEVFVTALRHEREDPGYLADPVWPWLRKVLVHIVWSRREREQRGRDLLHLLIARVTGADHEERLDILAALHSLPLRMRQCATLFYLEDLDTAAIATLMDCSPRTVETQLRNARSRLRHSLGDAYAEVLQQEVP